MLFAPIILCFSMPSCAQEMVSFVSAHTVDVEGVGSVCSYSLFDFGRCLSFVGRCEHTYTFTWPL